ncbi:MAG TPA: hydroxymethylbilane synthase [Rhizomicrobium sp.]|nr:hydroxymethylbilane synthase [Rhizomicrobium sp.]
MRLGSRGSPLAMTQSRQVAALLAQSIGETPIIQSFVTSGDRIADRRLQEAGGKGLFTKELDEALLDNRIDAAIHSLKDLPTRMPDGITLAAIPSREDPRDAFISPKARDLNSLTPGAVVGTASLRRQAQTLHLRPDLEVVTLRGSVETRLSRIAEGRMDATFLALAGLTRMGLTNHAASLVNVEEMPPAPGQGALAITCRTEDTKSLEILARMSDPALEIVIAAERGFLEALDGSCRTPIGALARLTNRDLHLLGEVLTPDGKKRWRREEWRTLGTDAKAEAAEFGHALGRDVRAEAGEAFIQSLEKRGW